MIRRHLMRGNSWTTCFATSPGMKARYLPTELRPRLRFGLMAAAFALTVAPVGSHPHIFVDGGIDFVLSDGPTLEALQVTWLYDEFETLVILSSQGMSLNDEGGLYEADLRQLIRLSSDWPDEIGGSAHLSTDGVAVALDGPTKLDARLTEGRLEVTFTRRLETPLPLGERTIEVAFYESTFFASYAISKPPTVFGDPGRCILDVHPFDPDPRDGQLLTVLSRLSREETPEIVNVGALFADRIIMQCA